MGDFLKDINPFKNVEVYASGVIKTSYDSEKIPNTTAVIPYGGGQVAWSSDKGGNARVITAADGYINYKQEIPFLANSPFAKSFNLNGFGTIDTRVMPTNGLVRIESNKNGPQGDWDPNFRMLFTIHKGGIYVPVFELPIKVGEYKIQGDAVFGAKGVRVGGRVVAETIRVLNYSVEVAAGARGEFKVPDIFDN